MSALGQKQTHALQQTSPLFDDLVSKRKQLCRRLKVQRLCCPEIDDQLAFGRRLHREIGRLGATENAVDVPCRLAEVFGSRSYFDALAILRSRWPVS
jgi:hypothetical protein